MSGGVDSSVVAHLLHEQGHEVIGVMMKLWTDPLAPHVRRTLPKKCCSIEHIQRARTVCASLDVPFYVVNMEQEFKDQVVDFFLDGYENGTTPNPCIECNKKIKFGILLQKAEELGCEKIATGHYVKTVDNNSTLALHQAEDTSRDQSYYLYTLTQEKLQKCIFPLGNMLKKDVFALAEKYGVPIPEEYAESEDLCFYPEKEPTAFLQRHLSSIQAGDIKNEEGEVLGRHKGLPFYTIGQRKGLGIGGLKIPLHVTKKDKDSNTIYVAPSGADLEYRLQANNVNWIEKAPTSPNSELTMRINSLGKKYTGKLEVDGDMFTFTFDEAVRGIAPGQSAVLYDNDRVIGGGVIA